MHLYVFILDSIDLALLTALICELSYPGVVVEALCLEPAHQELVLLSAGLIKIYDDFSVWLVLLQLN